MDFQLSEDEQRLQRTVRTFARRYPRGAHLTVCAVALRALSWSEVLSVLAFGGWRG